MAQYISFLIGINMTGHNSLKMGDLSSLYIGLGYPDALTYIQSGNVIFSSEIIADEREIALKIEKAILEKFNYVIPVMIRTTEELRNLFSVNPYLSEEKFEPSKMAVIFLHEKVTEEQIQKVKGIDYPPDKFKIVGKEIFIFCPNGFGRTKLYTNFFEKKMGVTGTARNWKTITTMLELAEKQMKKR
jgi:uncharacterized protein (DUF1697 family)